MCRFSKREIETHKPLALGETVKSRDILAVGNLNIEDRLLHYFPSYVIIPKFSNHSQINDIELQSMYALKHNLEINWAWTVMRHMWSVRETHNSLPYAIIISNILEHFGVSTASESKITLNTRESKIDEDMIMDELFSLRGYISNQMDAFDAQNQQVQLELQRFSYKINMMDLDEDSSEPES
ncbi:hypothetical protein Lal_00042386 [Lupinus albus]|nr:hypothetical protein Lal_00042386 [Lupinus albus]